MPLLPVLLAPSSNPCSDTMKQAEDLIKQIVPTVPEILREALIVIGGVLVASWVLSNFPALKSYVTANSVTLSE